MSRVGLEEGRAPSSRHRWQVENKRRGWKGCKDEPVQPLVPAGTEPFTQTQVGGHQSPESQSSPESMILMRMRKINEKGRWRGSDPITADVELRFGIVDEEGSIAVGTSEAINVVGHIG